MFDYFDTVDVNELNTYKYNDVHRPLDNSGNSVRSDTSYYGLQHINFYPILNGTKCIVLF